jgi:hypothetical protein
VTVTLTVETQHGDPDRVAEDASARAREPRLPFIVHRPERRIPVWREARWIANSSGVTQNNITVTFEHTFDETVISGTREITTPTDYFRYDVAVAGPPAPADSIGSPALQLMGNHAFLLENQWIAPLPPVEEAVVGAAPDEFIVYYADMFPFRRDPRDPTTWLRREDVPDYVHSQFVPRMVEAFRVQTDEWGFPWYDAWTSYRSGPDAERLSVALTDGRTWFHGRAPVRGHSGISINVTGGDNGAYETLTDGVMSSFHHELFHNLQRNISRNEGNTETVAGVDNLWGFFSEGTAVLASSVGQPNPQFASTSRAYIARANNYIGAYGPTSDLNTSYQDLFPYNAAIYWRFLYEQCGRATDGSLDPAAGMDIVRRTLTILYSGEIADVATSVDLVGALPRIMDRALADSTCPFDTHAESLAAFARDLYALRLEGGRCVAPGIPAGCGFYDPHHLYDAPPIDTVSYSGTQKVYDGEIPSSFGIDFVDVTVGDAPDGNPLTVAFHQPPGSAAEFTVQVRELKHLREDATLWPAPTSGVVQGALMPRPPGDELSYVIPVDKAEYDRLGLIVTRVDANEGLDPMGEYKIVVSPAGPDVLACAQPNPTHC